MLPATVGRLLCSRIAVMGLTTLVFLTGLFGASGNAIGDEACSSHEHDKKPNIVFIMTDDIGYGDLGCYGGGATRGSPTPHLDQLAKEGTRFTQWYGQASCTAGRASLLTGRIPIRTGLSCVIGPGSKNYLLPGTPTMSGFFKEHGYQTYFSGKWNLGDVPDSYPTKHGHDEMKHMLCYYASVYSTTDLKQHPDFPIDDPEFMKSYYHRTNDGEYEGHAGEEPDRVIQHFNYQDLSTIDDKQRDSAIQYLRKHASHKKEAEAKGKSTKPFFMHVNFMKCHNPTNPSPLFKGKSHENAYLDSIMEVDFNSGMIVDAIRELGLDQETIVVWTTDNGPWIDAWPDAGYTPFRGMKGTCYEGGWRVPAIMWWPGHIQAGRVADDITSHMDMWSSLAAMAGLKPPPHGPWKEKHVFYDGIDNSEYLLGKATESARSEWIYISDLTFGAVRSKKWKFVFTAKDAWLGPNLPMDTVAIYNLKQDPGESYDMYFNGAAPKTSGILGTSPGRYSGADNAWTLMYGGRIIDEFTASVKAFPNIETVPGSTLGAGVPTFLPPNLVPYVKPDAPHRHHRDR